MSASTTVFVVRHAEKMAGRGLADVDLTERGHARARALATDGAVREVSRVFVSPYLRTHQTARPLMDALGLDPVEYAANDVQGVSRLALEHRPGSSLIVGHCDTVPAIIRALGVTGESVGFVTRYGDLFEVRLEGIGAILVRRTFG